MPFCDSAGFHFRRRCFIIIFLLTTGFLCLRQSALLSSASKRPQVNDRRILESKTVNVLPGAMPPLVQNTAAKAVETKENSPDIHLFSQTNRPILTSLAHEHFKVSSSAEGEQKPMVVDNNEQNIIAVVLVIAAKRDLAIKNHLQQLIKYVLHYFTFE
ncbi:unnamed protein product [Gongylonema pulchrum]|uniref:Beta-hexosaminidase n=1 Tax=Gongylonema pulchrum TaxID=637853 RepID=A0A183E7Z5_9BILA|nr:unnamed protein product [Gongylonema pulchrum]